MLHALPNFLRMLKTLFPFLIRAFAGNATITIRKKLAKNDAKGINISTIVKRHITFHLLRSSIFVRPRWLLEHPMIIAIRQAKIYQFDILTVAGNQNIIRFQISMDNLKAVIIRHSIQQFLHNLQANLP